MTLARSYHFWFQKWLSHAVITSSSKMTLTVWESWPFILHGSECQTDLLYICGANDIYSVGVIIVYWSWIRHLNLTYMLIVVSVFCEIVWLLWLCDCVVVWSCHCAIIVIVCLRNLFWGTSFFPRKKYSSYLPVFVHYSNGKWNLHFSFWVMKTFSIFRFLLFFVNIIKKYIHTHIFINIRVSCF